MMALRKSKMKKKMLLAMVLLLGLKEDNKVLFLVKISLKLKLYLIRGCARNGWPGTTNTWEPPENLESIPDIVEAFEERSNSGDANLAASSIART
ncbi:hypothetical protein JHK85_007373 [Glycine max]|nr:hypothetical protein JHK85_007373 [Glycine max]